MFEQLLAPHPQPPPPCVIKTTADMKDPIHWVHHPAVPCGGGWMLGLQTLQTVGSSNTHLMNGNPPKSPKAKLSPLLCLYRANHT
jgi:hypothetical protein